MTDNGFRWLLGEECEDPRLHNILDWFCSNNVEMFDTPDSFESYMSMLYERKETMFSLRGRVAKAMFSLSFDDEGVCTDTATVVRDDKYGAYFTWHPNSEEIRGQDKILARLLFRTDFNRRSRLIAVLQEVLNSDVLNEHDVIHRILNIYQSDDEVTYVNQRGVFHMYGRYAYQDIIEMLFPNKKLNQSVREFTGFKKLYLHNSSIKLDVLYACLDNLHYSFAQTEIQSSVLHELYESFLQNSSAKLSCVDTPTNYLKYLDVNQSEWSEDQKIMYLLLLFCSLNLEWSDTENIAYAGWKRVRERK